MTRGLVTHFFFTKERQLLFASRLFTGHNTVHKGSPKGLDQTEHNITHPLTAKGILLAKIKPPH